MSSSSTLALRLTLVCFALGCSDTSSSDKPDRPSSDEPTMIDGGTPSNPFDSPVDPVPGNPRDASVPIGLLELTPTMPMLTVTADEPQPTLQFELLRDGMPLLGARWSVLDAEFGTIDEDGLFTASGAVGGQTQIDVFYGEQHRTTQITIRITSSQNGATDDGSAQGAGGYAGVGGEGPGGPVDEAVQKLLDGTPSDDPSLSFLYPYDGTVFPLGMLAPLLQWSESDLGVVEAIHLHLSGLNYDYHGYFGRPPALADGAPFVRHPIPQAVWAAATRSVRGAALNAALSVVIDGKHYGPIEQQWVIANGELKGTVYYQSYGTDLVKNHDQAVAGDGRFGGATLAIRPGEPAPRLVAGMTTNDLSGCRVCHSVSSQGGRMVVQHGDNYSASSSYDLLNNNAEQIYPDTTYTPEALLAWIGLSPDGKLGLGNARPLGVPNPSSTQLYDMDTGALLTTTGLSDFVTIAAFPAFSHGGDQVAFQLHEGPGDGTIGAGDGRKLVMMDFDASANRFSNPKLLYEADEAPGWPSFTPDGGSVVFEALLQSGGNEYFYSWRGGKGELWWSNLRSGQSYPLRNLNGTDYLPTGPNNHDADHQLNYEPTVAPIASGGYAWIVFMSRRMYGNVATIDPWRSDPRNYDHTQEITTKKLWVAAIDLNVAQDLDNASIESMLGEDPSHPAFYLPGQELHAGNTRGFWVVDPCRADGEDCESGVECCTGRCQAEPETGELTCGLKTPECAAEFDRCETSGDCCDDTFVCLNQICTRVGVN